MYVRKGSEGDGERGGEKEEGKERGRRRKRERREMGSNHLKLTIRVESLPALIFNGMTIFPIPHVEALKEC